MTAARIRTQFPIAVSSHQPSAVSHKPSAISHQPSTIGHQPSAISQFRFPAISRQPSAIGRQPSANFGSQPSAVGRQPSAISHHSSAREPNKGSLSDDSDSTLGSFRVRLDLGLRVSHHSQPRREATRPRSSKKERTIIFPLIAEYGSTG